MLIDLKKLMGLKVIASNESVGKINDIYFNENDWNIAFVEIKPRLLVLKNILVNHFKLGQPDFNKKILPVMVSKEQFFNGPEADSVATRSDQKTNRQAAFMTWPLNVSNLYVLDFKEAKRLAEIMVSEKIRDENEDSDLRSFKEITGYSIQTSTGTFGHLKSMIVETYIWKIKYLLIQKNRLFKANKKILISPASVKDTKWENNSVTIDVSKNIIRQSPSYKDIKSISDNYERRLLNYYLRNNRNQNRKKIKQ